MIVIYFITWDQQFHFVLCITNPQEDYFVLRTQEYVMNIDAGGSSRPVVVMLTNPDDINQAFDSITYDKVGHNSPLT